MVVITLILASQVLPERPLKVLIKAYGLCVRSLSVFLLRVNISIYSLSAIKAAISKLCFAWEWVPVLTWTTRTQMLSLLYQSTDCVRCAHASSCVRALVIILNYICDFATRYVSFIQIWRTEYTRTQLPGPPEEPVSPGLDQTERDGNFPQSWMRYAFGCCIYNTDKCEWLTVRKPWNQLKGNCTKRHYPCFYC